jgi:hypothetical protein
MVLTASMPQVKLTVTFGVVERQQLVPLFAANTVPTVFLSDMRAGDPTAGSLDAHDRAYLFPRAILRRSIVWS